MRGAPTPVWRGELYFETHRGTLTSQLRTKLGNRRCERLLVEAELWAATLGRSAEVDDLWREVLTQQFHDILPGLVDRVGPRRRRGGVRTGGQPNWSRIARRASRSARLGAGGRSLANPADSPVDGVVVLDAELPTPAPRRAQRPRRRPRRGRRRGSRRSVSHRSRRSADRRPRRAVRLVDDQLAPRGALGRVREHHLDHRSRPAHASSSRPARSRRCSSWPPTIRSSTTRGTSSRGPRNAGAHGRRPTLPRSRSSTPDHSSVGSRSSADVRAVVDHRHLRAARRQRANSSSTSSSTGTTTSTCCRWRSRSTCAPTRRCATSSSVSSPRPTHPSNPWDAAKFEVCAHRFVDVAEPDFGVAILNNGRYGHSVFDGAIRVSLARAAKYPDPRCRSRPPSR